MALGGVQNSFDALAFAAYVRRRWLFVVLACGIACAVTLGASLLLPKRYTATASLLIEAPGGNDARITTAVSPVYLESLKSYEHFAASDTLFRKALERFQLRASDAPSIESMKRRVLRVSKLRDTRILQIQVTLPDPKVAQALAQFLAEETLRLNETLIEAGGNEVETAAVKNRDAAGRELEKLRAEWAGLTAREPLARLQSDLRALEEVRAKVREEILQTEVELAGDEQRQKESPAWKSLAAATRARAGVLQAQSERLDRDVQSKAAALAQLQTKQQLLEMKVRAAQAAFDAAEARLRDARSPLAVRGERLRIVDPGVVPERPTSPNIPLNVLVAAVTAALGCLLYLGAAFQTRPAPVRAAMKHVNA